MRLFLALVLCVCSTRAFSPPQVGRVSNTELQMGVQNPPPTAATPVKALGFLGASFAFLGAAVFNPIASQESPGFMSSPLSFSIPAIVQENKAGAKPEAVKAVVKPTPKAKAAPKKVGKSIKQQGYDFEGAASVQQTKPAAAGKKEAAAKTKADKDALAAKQKAGKKAATEAKEVEKIDELEAKAKEAAAKKEAEAKAAVEKEAPKKVEAEKSASVSEPAPTPKAEAPAPAPAPTPKPTPASAPVPSSGASGGKVLPKEEVSPELLNMLKKYN